MFLREPRVQNVEEPTTYFDRKYFHDSVDGIDQLIGPVRMFRSLKACRVFIGQVAIETPRFGSNSLQNFVVSHYRYVLAYCHSCAIQDIRSLWLHG
jgi:hypothetical protein